MSSVLLPVLLEGHLVVDNSNFPNLLIWNTPSYCLSKPIGPTLISQVLDSLAHATTIPAEWIMRDILKVQSPESHRKQ